LNQFTSVHVIYLLEAARWTLLLSLMIGAILSGALMIALGIFAAIRFGGSGSPTVPLYQLAREKTGAVGPRRHPCGNETL